MEFIVRRTSDISNEKPIEGAYLEKLEYYDVREQKTFGESDKKLSNVEAAFLSEGRDHKINEDGNIQRTLDKDEWCIHIEDLNHLININKSDGDLIIINDPNYDLSIIEIYDDYRE